MSVRKYTSSRRWRYGAIAAGAAAAVAAATGVAQAASSSPTSLGDTVHACVSQSNGAVRIVAEGVSCRNDEYAASWNSQGPQGQAGPTGAQGQTGATGPQGPAGPAGAAAPDPTPRQKTVGEVTLTPVSGAPVSFAIYGFSGSQQQTLNIGSQSTGAGAGKVTFEPFSMTKLPDASSPQLFDWLAAGNTLKSGQIDLYGANSNDVAETYKLNLVALASLTTSNDGSATDRLHEDLTLEVGGITVEVGDSSGGWNRVTNTPTS